LQVQLTESGEGLEGYVEYDTDLFEAGTVERLVRHYQRLLESAVAEPDRPVGRLALVTEQEQRELAAWNAAQARPELGARCVHELIEEQVRRTPEAVAVECAGEALTYAELDRRANQVARYLGERGGRPGD